MILQILKEKDLAQLLLVEQSAHIAPWSEDIFQHCFRSGSYFWGMIDDEQLLGFVVFSVQVGECHILNLCVDPQHQRQGLGNQLLMHALTRAKHKGAQIAYLEVRRSNKPAIKLYE